MSAQMSNTTWVTTMPSIRSWMPLIIIAAVIAALALHNALYGAAAREKAARFHAEEINQENSVLCEKLGIPQGTDRFAACADILSQARQDEARRVAGDAAGML